MASRNAGHVDSTLASPANGTPLEGNYFDASNPSTAATTPSRTPSLKSEDAPQAFPTRIVSKQLPVLMREFPKPADEVDVKAALERQPGRWTVQGQINAREQREKQTITDEAAAKAKRTQDFEAAKQSLKALPEFVPPPRANSD